MKLATSRIAGNGLVVCESGFIRLGRRRDVDYSGFCPMVGSTESERLFLMSDVIIPSPERRTWPQRVPFYYGWVQVVIAALAMTATMPGRTHGLGLITEPLLRDLQLDHTWYARANLIASLLGALFCLPVGWMIDRYGVRSTLVAITAALGVSVVGLSQSTGGSQLFFWLLLTRGFGQSALSVVSIAAIGKWFNSRAGMAMGLFAVLLTIGFIAGVLIVGPEIERVGWRAAWSSLGWVVLSLAPIFWLLARNSPEACRIQPDPLAVESTPVAAADHSYSLRQALAGPVFWIVLIGCSAFNFVSSGVMLFNESLMLERGLDAKASVEILAILTGIGLLANIVGGKLASRGHIPRLLSASLVLLAVALIVFPQIDSLNMARCYAAAMGLSGGLITVIFFAAWGHLFGREHLGRIQGVAQFATVLASALGPVYFAEVKAAAGSYTPGFHLLAAVVGLLAIISFFAPLPPASPAGRAE
jgi:MFS transporter, OFA family, oxalate/formate antiporter